MMPRPVIKLLREQMTPAEQVFWLAVKAKNYNQLKFRRQALIGPFVVDFFCPAYKLVVELDGGIHNEPDVVAYDIERQAWIESEGYTVLRFSNEEVLKNLEGVLQYIWMHIQNR